MRDFVAGRFDYLLPDDFGGNKTPVGFADLLGGVISRAGGQQTNHSAEHLVDTPVLSGADFKAL